MSDSKVTRLGTGSSIILGPRVSRAIYGALIGEWPVPLSSDVQAVLVEDTAVVAAFLGTEDQIDELVRVNEELRKAGIEFPLGARGVHDLALIVAGYGEDIDGILADAGLPYAARGIEGLRALVTSYAAARAEVQRLDGEVKQLRTELYQARRDTDGQGYDVEQTIRQPIYQIEE